MAKTKQEKEDAKREREYEKKHKRKYRLTPGDIVFYIFNYLFFTLFTITCIFPFCALPWQMTSLIITAHRMLSHRMLPACTHTICSLRRSLSHRKNRNADPGPF